MHFRCGYSTDMIDLSHYKTLVFDCDGVVLDSNKVKSDAFYKAALPYGENAANTLLEYHKNTGGVSRYKKFRYFLDNIVENELENFGYDALLEAYAKNVMDGMLTCNVAENIDKLREETKDITWLIVSGGDQEELRGIFKQRKLYGLFDGDIFGSPDTKEVILEREIQNDNIKLPALFLGDSRYDRQASLASGLDFIFISDWTEVNDWEEWVNKNNLKATQRIEDLIK